MARLIAGSSIFYAMRHINLSKSGLCQLWEAKLFLIIGSHSGRLNCTIWSTSFCCTIASTIFRAIHGDFLFFNLSKYAAPIPDIRHLRSTVLTVGNLTPSRLAITHFRIIGRSDRCSNDPLFIMKLNFSIVNLSRKYDPSLSHLFIILLFIVALTFTCRYLSICWS